MKNDRMGFTLVEVMVVTGIVSLLSAIAIPNLMRSRINSNEANAQASLKTISNALENYAIVNSVYPPNTTALTSATPPYLNIDFFTQARQGYTFDATLTSYTYSVIAEPTSSSMGIRSFTISTGGILAEN